MSRALAKAKRQPLDGYYTPDALAVALWRTFVISIALGWELRRAGRPLQVLEPSVGGGAWVRAVRGLSASADAHVTGVDIDPSATGLAAADLGIVGDFVRFARMEPYPEPDVVVGNPPYSVAAKHVEVALNTVRVGGAVAFLLRLAFLESEERTEFWARFKPAVVVPLAHRPSFSGGGTDNCAYGLFVWRNASVAASVTPRLAWPPLRWKP